MQRMRSQIPPEPIQPNFCSRRSRARDFKHSRSDLETSVCSDDLETSDPFGKLAALLGCNRGTVL